MTEKYFNIKPTVIDYIRVPVYIGDKMKICFPVYEIFHYGYYGGYGRLMRDIGKELVKRGDDVNVVIPSGKGRKRLDKLDCMNIYNSPLIPFLPKTCSLPFEYFDYKKIDADLFYHCESSTQAYFAIKSMPTKNHVITFQDPRDETDYKQLIAYPLSDKKECFEGMHWITGNPLSSIFFKMKHKAVQEADMLFTQANYLKEKVKKLYDVKTEPLFVPNPVDIPNRKMKKSEKPLICFLARLNPIKRPEIFFELSRFFPEVNFMVIGGSQGYDSKLLEPYTKLPNLKFLGFIADTEEKSRLLEKAWILVNTSLHEALPVSFLEAWAHECAVLSCQNPDNLVQKYGYFTGEVKGSETIKFVEGLKYLLYSDTWKHLGKKGSEYVSKTHNLTHVIDLHQKYFRECLEDKE